MVRQEKEILSKREFEVATLKCRGMTRGEIADKLFIDERTAKNHINSINRKTNSKTEAMLMQWYFNHYKGINLQQLIQ